MKRFLCLILSALLLLSATACAKGEGGDQPSDTAATTPVSEAETADLSFTDELPDLDFKDDVIHMIGGDKISIVDELVAEQYNGDLINDAVYERNKAIEGRLHVIIEAVAEGGLGANGSADYYIGDTIHRLVTTGDNEYQLVSVPSYVGVQYAVKGDYRDLSTLDHLDLTKAYWAQGYNEMATWGGDHQFLASGAAAISLFRYMYITLYNKGALEEQQLEDPYNAALNGDWTLEYQHNMVNGVYKDINGNGKEDSKDFFGFVSGSHTSGDCYWIGGDAHVLQKDEDGYFFYEPDIARLDSVMDRVMTLYYTPGSFLWATTNDSTDSTNIIDAFAEGRAMMSTVMLGKIETGLRDFTGDYGILPMPKYDAAQPNYRTCVQDQVSGFAIPTTVPDNKLDEMGAVMECFASESYKHVVNAYYNTALSYKYLNNPESVTMLDLTYRSVAFEIAQIYTACLGSGSSTNFLEIMREILGSKKNTVASRFKKLEKSMKRAVTTLNGDLEKVINGQS